jgi:predicted amidohydrolase
MDLRVAAVPMASIPFAWGDNTERAFAFAQRAAARGAELVLLPELFAIGYCYTPRLLEFAEPRCGSTSQWLLRTSRQTNAYVGGCFVERSGQRHYDTFMLAAPYGEKFFYRKQRLPLIERLYFDRDTQPGIFDTSLGRIGVLICWDITSNRVVDQLLGKIDLVLICCAWPDTSRGNIPLPWLAGLLRRLAMSRPIEIARRLGVPTVVCNMGGRFSTRVPFSVLRYRSPFVASTALIGSDGRVLSRAAFDDEPLIGTLERKGHEKPVMARRFDRRHDGLFGQHSHLSDRASPIRAGERDGGTGD